MGTVLRQLGFAVVIHTHDHLPPHVHIFKGGAELIVNLGTATAGPSVRDNIGMSGSEERRALALIANQQASLLAAWERIHGHT